MTDTPESRLENASSVIEILDKIRVLSRELMELPPVSEETLTSIGLPEELTGVLLNHRRNVTSVELTTHREIEENLDQLKYLERRILKLMFGTQNKVDGDE